MAYDGAHGMEGIAHGAYAFLISVITLLGRLFYIENIASNKIGGRMY